MKYNSNDIDLYMSAKESHPEYSSLAHQYIERALGFIPAKLPNFAEIELAVRLTIKQMKENNNIDEAFLSEMIIRLFNLQDSSNEYEKMHKQAEETAKSLIKELADKTPTERYVIGKEDGYNISKFNPRMAQLIYYKMRNTKQFNYGSDRLNVFMALPQNLPEYSEIAREYIEKSVGNVADKNKDLAINELAIRILCMKMEENAFLDDEYLQDFIKRLFGLHEDCEVQSNQKTNLN